MGLLNSEVMLLLTIHSAERTSLGQRERTTCILSMCITRSKQTHDAPMAFQDDFCLPGARIFIRLVVSKSVELAKGTFSFFLVRDRIGNSKELPVISILI